ncbi:hypothetical protein N656DRAFT_752406 [Canariomyces notabilis]|uniref:Uncharacterized protein n=1 Tax=Canariomyces notabilis TaxID=2074819 RepID=A0AAN6TG41_9PEZI|nr:hypothetical protein N656DRAFT_752406 [Canariomyces arenarius]
MPRVPTTAAVFPGANVNIVLKADQPTGRTVSGTVAEVLTRGNHPRGIKVRLVDNRVGRVQSIAGASVTTTDAANIESEALPDEPQSTNTRGNPRARRVRDGPVDVRGEEQPLATIGLDAGNAGDDDGVDSHSGGIESQPQQEQEVSTCPVCSDFNGDVAALTYHVQSHFD